MGGLDGQEERRNVYSKYIQKKFGNELKIRG